MTKYIKMNKKYRNYIYKAEPKKNTIVKLSNSI